jgi:hypothetical protein
MSATSQKRGNRKMSRAELLSSGEVQTPAWRG